MSLLIRDDDSAGFKPKLLPAHVLRSRRVDDVSGQECAHAGLRTEADGQAPAAAGFKSPLQAQQSIVDLITTAGDDLWQLRRQVLTAQSQKLTHQCQTLAVRGFVALVPMQLAGLESAHCI